MRQPQKSIALWIVAALLLPSVTFAELGSLTGEVVTMNGQALPGAVVRLTSEDGQFEIKETTDAEGRFSFADIPAGYYSLEVSLEGFASENIPRLEMPSEVATLTISMQSLAVEPMPANPGTAHSVEPFRQERICRPALSPEFRSICFLGMGGYAFNTPPGLHYLESAVVHFRLHPEEDALRAAEVFEDLGLRGAVEAGTTEWTRCMEAELVETTIDSPLRARPAEAPRLGIRQLVKSPDLGDWAPAEDGVGAVKKMGLHPAEWRWRITGIRPGRTQLSLRLYAVSVLAGSEPGDPICAPRPEDGSDHGRRRVQTLQRHLAIDVSTARWLDAKLPTPWIWIPLLAPIALGLNWLRRRA